MANAIKKISVQRGYDVTEYTLLLRRRRRPARLPGGRRARHDARASSIRSPACCRPTAWAWPTVRRCASGGRGAARRGALPAAGRGGSTRSRRRRARELARRASSPPRASRERARAPEVRGHRHGARRRARHAKRSDASRVRGGLPQRFASCCRARAGRRGGHRSRRSARPAHAARRPAADRGPPGGGRAPARRGHGARSAAGGAGTTRRCSGARRSRRARAIDGPAIIAEANATTVVEPGWRATMTARGTSCSSASWRATAHAIGTEADPVMLEIFNNLFMSIAEQMGVTLAEHRLLGEHQGAARLLLRAVRRRGQPDRQRAAHAGAPGLDGRERAAVIRERRAACARATCTC
jgi:5-oxoprolinase (ATP-hydrolysing)